MFMAIAFKPGDRVRIREAEFDAVVNKVIIDRSSVSYECQYWNDKTCIWTNFYESELVAVEESEKIEVGVIKWTSKY